jgi:hypothetical protein
MAAVPLAEPDVAVIVAVPFVTAVTSPADETVATEVFDDDHVATESPRVVPSESLTVAVSVTVSPADVNAAVLGDTVTEEAIWVTVISAFPLTEPEVAVIVAVPLATAVTSPADETVTIVVSDDTHVTVAPEITDPPASFTVAERVAVSPIDSKLFELGDTVTLAASWPNVTDTDVLAEPDCARTVALPTDMAVTSPLPNTVATAGLDELHVTVAPAITFPPASLTVAARVAVSPTDEKASEDGETSRVSATWATVTGAAALNEPEAARIAVEPSVTAVTSPAAEIVATNVSEDDHVTVASEITDPRASLTVAVKLAVSAIDEKVSELGVTASVVET